MPVNNSSTQTAINALLYYLSSEDFTALAEIPLNEKGRPSLAGLCAWRDRIIEAYTCRPEYTYVCEILNVTDEEIEYGHKCTPDHVHVNHIYASLWQHAVTENPDVIEARRKARLAPKKEMNVKIHDLRARKISLAATYQKRMKVLEPQVRKATFEALSTYDGSNHDGDTIKDLCASVALIKEVISIKEDLRKVVNELLVISPGTVEDQDYIILNMPVPEKPAAPEAPKPNPVEPAKPQPKKTKAPVEPKPQPETRPAQSMTEYQINKKVASLLVHIHCAMPEKRLYSAYGKTEKCSCPIMHETYLLHLRREAMAKERIGAVAGENRLSYEGAADIVAEELKEMGLLFNVDKNGQREYPVSVKMTEGRKKCPVRSGCRYCISERDETGSQPQTQDCPMCLRSAYLERLVRARIESREIFAVKWDMVPVDK